MRGLSIVTVVVVLTFAHIIPTTIGHCRGLHCKPEPWRGGAGLFHEPSDPKPGVHPFGPLFAPDLNAASVSTASLELSPKQLSAVNPAASITWKGVTDVADDDWIGIYSPSTAEDEQYIDYFYAKDVITYKGGFGEFNLTLVDMRTDYEVRYWQRAKSASPVPGGGAFPGWTRIAISNAAEFPPVAAGPTQIHLSLTDSSSEMRVMFVTDSADTPTVYYQQESTLGDGTPMKATGTSVTYTADMMCAPPANQTGPNAWINPGYIHDVVMTRLVPGSNYKYTIGDTQFGGVFTAAPVQGAPLGRPLTFTAYGDLDESFPPGAISTLARTKSLLNETDFVLHVGDLSYARGIGYKWEQFFHNIEPVASTKPYMICLGNHEYDHEEGGEKDPSGAPGQGFHPSWGNYGSDSNGECGVPTFYRFHMPQDSFAEHNRRQVMNAHHHRGVHHGEAKGRFWYAYTIAQVRFLVMSTEHDFTPGSPQYEWLEIELATRNRTATPWLILVGHRPMYCSENYMGDYNVTLGMQRAFEPLINQYDVDLALWGHYHSYERTCPVFENKCQSGYHNAKAPVHVVIGMAGASLDTADYLGKEWSMYHDQVFGYSRVAVYNESALHFAYYHNADNKLADEFWLTKS